MISPMFSGELAGHDTDAAGFAARYLDAIKANDGEWFAQHPNQDIHNRAHFIGEFYPNALPRCAEVRVVRIAPGERRVVPLIPGGMPFTWTQRDDHPESARLAELAATGNLPTFSDVLRVYAPALPDGTGVAR